MDLPGYDEVVLWIRKATNMDAGRKRCVPPPGLKVAWPSRQQQQQAPAFQEHTALLSSAAVQHHTCSSPQHVTMASKKTMCAAMTPARARSETPHDPGPGQALESSPVAGADMGGSLQLSVGSTSFALAKAASCVPNQPASIIKRDDIHNHHRLPGHHKLLRQLEQCNGDDKEESKGTKDSRWLWITSGRRDAKGRPKSDPGFDSTSLHIPPQALEGMTGFPRAFWSIKRTHMDVVLFVRHGTFYNLFDEDADVGMRAGLALSGKGTTNMWKCGCTKDAFPAWCKKVLALGYCVGRVEEESRSATASPVSPKPKDTVLQRRLVRIYTPGTATDSYMDIEPAVASGTEGVTPASHTGPVLALVEAPNGLIGVALLDVMGGTLQLGHLNDGPGRTLLRTLLHRNCPAEAVTSATSLAPCTASLFANLGHGPTGNGSSQLPAALTVLPEDMSAALQLVCHCQGETSAAPQAALLRCQQLLQRTAAQALQPPCIATILSTLQQAAAAVPCAVQAAAVLFQHLDRCKALVQCVHNHPTFTVLPLDGGRSQESGAVTGGRLHMDCNALLQLEVLQNAEGGRKGSLLSLLDRSACPMGRKRVREWLCRPLVCAITAEERLGVVELFMTHPDLRHEVQNALAGLPDLERLLPRAAEALATLAGTQRQDDGSSTQAKDSGAGTAWLLRARSVGLHSLWQLLAGLAVGNEALYHLQTHRQGVHCSNEDAALPLLQNMLNCAAAAAEPLQQLEKIFDYEKCLDDEDFEPHLQPGAAPLVDQLAAQLFQSELQATVVFHRLGEQLKESCGVSPAQLKRVQHVGQGVVRSPAALEAVLKKVGCLKAQHTGSSVTMVLPALAEAVNRTVDLQDQYDEALAHAVGTAAAIFHAAYTLFAQLLDVFGTLDAVAGFALAIAPNAAPPGLVFCRPVFTAISPDPNSLCQQLWLKDFWHPMLPEAHRFGEAQGHNSVSPNTLQLGGPDGSIPATLLLTGANMGGKSTLLRAMCTAVIMAQVGCYVPASMAYLSPVDCIFTRMGAHDKIMAGQSTFACEMAEAAKALEATRASLVVLDEMGRGTATHDGTALAFGALCYLSQTLGCRTLFATHYHSLTQEQEILPHVVLAHMSHSITAEGSFIPLHQLQAGPAPEGSSGIAVARLAGLPARLLARAQQKGAALEQFMQARSRASRRQSSNKTSTCGTSGDTAGRVVLQQVVSALQRLPRSGDISVPQLEPLAVLCEQARLVVQQFSSRCK